MRQVPSPRSLFHSWMPGVVLALSSLPAVAETLSPIEHRPAGIVRSAERERVYVRLAAGERATYLFCGAGELQVVSRAVLAPRAGKARYTLRTSVDGERPARERTYRVDAHPTAGLDDGSRVTALRRMVIDLERGCHTVAVTALRSTAAQVVLRLTWTERPATKRQWSPASPSGAVATASLDVGDLRTPYFVLADGETMDVSVAGPAWLRLLARTTGRDEASEYELTVRRKGKTLRSYRLASRPSRRARWAERPDRSVGRADEVVLAVAEGSQRLTIQASPGLELLVRPMASPRADDRDNTARTTTAWRSRGRLSSFYDDNILRYSEKFIQRFENGEDPGRFRVESLDDVVQRLDLYVDRRFAGLGGKSAEVGLEVTHRAYARNSIKDWTRLAVDWERDLGLARSLRFAASWAPDFYVRHLRDSDLTGQGRPEDRFQAFAFDKGDLRGELATPWGTSTDVRFHLGVAGFRHTDAFREFDSTNLFSGIRLDHSLSGGLRFSAAAELTDSDARGFDQPGERLETSDDTDPSYRQVDVMLAARYVFPGERRPTLFVQGEVGLRDYTTDKGTVLAPLHSGREDDLLRWFASWSLRLSTRYRLTVFAQRRERSSTAPVRLDIGVEKDYEQFELGARISARFGS